MFDAMEDVFFLNPFSRKKWTWKPRGRMATDIRSCLSKLETKLGAENYQSSARIYFADPSASRKAKWGSF